jgi:hypothetical protein
MTQKKLNGTGFAIYADAMGLRKPLDIHASFKNKDMVTSTGTDNKRIEVRANMGADAFQTIDFASWLPFAARELHISPDIMDYVIVPVVTMPTGLPNRNGVAFPLKEMIKFNVDQGRQAYKTFVGKPTYIEHNNDDPTQATGVIADSTMRKFSDFGDGKIWKLLTLHAIDRTKNPTLAARTLSGDLNSYSMGAWVEAYTCGYCQAAMGSCNHLNPKQPRDFYVLNGRLVFRQVHGITGFEQSTVETPAFISAISDKLMML